MSFSHLATIVLWFVPAGLQVAIATVMLRRRLAKVFPVFFTYNVLVPSRDILLFFLPHPGNLYALIYWCGDALAILLGLGVIVETVKHLFPPYPLLRILIRVIWIVGAIAGAAALVMLALGSASGADQVFDFILLAERSARLLQVCLLIVVIAVMSRLGLTWHHYSVGIVAGFGIYSALDLAVLEFRGHLHLLSNAAFVLLKPAAYNLAVMIWAYYFLRSWQRRPAEKLPKTNLAEWNETVTEYVNQWSRRY
jgi:hypothetical protein